MKTILLFWALGNSPLPPGTFGIPRRQTNSTTRALDARLARAMGDVTLTLMGPPSPEPVADWIREGLQRKVEVETNQEAHRNQNHSRRTGDKHWSLPNLSVSTQPCETCMEDQNWASRRHG